jgi:hypothetical protein
MLLKLNWMYWFLDWGSRAGKRAGFLTFSLVRLWMGRSTTAAGVFQQSTVMVFRSSGRFR